ncbi:hypothetical protein AAFF_G00359600 [Aldrovandia affinis]|uniref:Uncharacterized protein n=1 Tax=Aldrovandia affinis TaxID=143900 RepID=A0AAD7SI86_9TELE|nr:hypothetical protein AAFF_G00359600 [Aldrovandia affinis]
MEHVGEEGGGIPSSCLDQKPKAERYTQLDTVREATPGYDRRGPKTRGFVCAAFQTDSPPLWNGSPHRARDRLAAALRRQDLADEPLREIVFGAHGGCDVPLSSAALAGRPLPLGSREALTMPGPLPAFSPLRDLCALGREKQDLCASASLNSARCVYAPRSRAEDRGPSRTGPRQLERCAAESGTPGAVAVVRLTLQRGQLRHNRADVALLRSAMFFLSPKASIISAGSIWMAVN